jgi:hypothetical protein
VKALITLVDDENYVAVPMETGVAIDAPNTSYFETSEHYDKEVTAPEGKMFGEVLFASYGIQNLEGNMVSIGWCHSKTSVELVEAALSNKVSGTIPASNGNYGDPCYGTYKYVKVVMSLIDNPDYVKGSAQTAAVDPASIAAPTNVVAVVGDGSASITWDASAEGNTEITGYLVQVSADGFENSVTIKVTSTDAIALGLANGQEHEIRVAGDNKADGVISEWSTIVKATPTAPAVTTTTTVVEEGTATKALVEAKKSKKGSNMGTALQIEMALEQARVFEEELKFLFMQTGKIDVWNKIKARQAEMDADDANDIRMFNASERKRKQREAELNEWAMIIGAVSFIVFIFAIGSYELIQFCQTGNRCGR